MLTDPPLIVTLALDAAGFRALDGLRRRHFPPGRNLVPAHVTLFHQLPASAGAEVAAALAAACGQRRPFPLAVLPAPRLLGRGVALDLAAPELVELRDDLAAMLAPLLTRQDRQPYRPHVTVQNKVLPAAARALAAALAADPPMLRVRALGLLLWRYLDGPWQPGRAFPFQDGAGPVAAEAGWFPPAPHPPTTG